MFDRKAPLQERIAQVEKHTAMYGGRNDALWPYQYFSITVGELLDELARLRAENAELKAGHTILNGLLELSNRQNAELAALIEAKDKALEQARAALMYYDFANGVPQAAFLTIESAQKLTAPDALAEHDRRRDAERWQPIETAPISGRGERPRWFLAFNGAHTGVCARWGDEGYGETIADDTDVIVEPLPTHWMPLPEAPMAERVEKGEPIA